MLIKLLLSLPIAILVNILLGVVIASVSVSLDKAKLWIGFLKGVAVYAAIGGLYLVALILPTVEVNGLGTIDIVNSLVLVLSAVLGFYVYQSLQKLATIFKLKYQIVQQNVELEPFDNDPDSNPLE
jgi:hypothetical protein